MKYSVGTRNINPIDADWDLCILIDSCRYDVFKTMYKDILKTDVPVKKACSHCSCTKEFTKNYLNRDYIDMVYVNHTVSLDYWIPNTKFFKKLDVWRTHWDYKKWGTIMPWDMTDETLKMIKKYPDKKIMLHYVQVHPPYLSEEYSKFNKIEFTPERAIKDLENGKRKSRKGFVQGVMRNTIGYERTWKLLSMLGIEASDGYGQMYQHFGMEGLINGYTINMKIVLNEIKRLLENYKGKVLITSDHSQNFNGSKKNMRKEYIPWLVLKC